MKHNNFNLKWLLVRSGAAMVGFLGWIIAAIGAFYVAFGALLVRWGRRLHTVADEIRYEA